MDFFNNSQGRDIGENYNITTPNSVIIQQITNAINMGTLKYLTPTTTEEPKGIVIPGQTQIKWTNQ